MDEMLIRPIAYIRTDFPEKFGIPRQSGLVADLKGKIVFEPEYRDINALREIDQYTHLWLIWGFSANKEKERWEPTVRPPRLGGNTRVGVFASRSPYRPNALGLTVVKLEGIEFNKAEGNVLNVSGIDIMDNTPIYDIKPYLPYVDSIEDASDGFALSEKTGKLEVIFENGTGSVLAEDKKETLKNVLSQDPRPQYQNEPERVYKMDFAGYNVSFSIDNSKVRVLEIQILK